MISMDVPTRIHSTFPTLLFTNEPRYEIIVTRTPRHLVKTRQTISDNTLLHDLQARTYHSIGHSKMLEYLVQFLLLGFRRSKVVFFGKVIAGRILKFRSRLVHP